MTSRLTSWFMVPFAAAALSVGAAVPAEAQQQQSGLVNVNISNIRTDLAELLNVDVSQVPVTVQAPIGVAANVCDVNANVLAEQRRNGGASCEADSTSTALNRIVQRQIRRG